MKAETFSPGDVVLKMSDAAIQHFQQQLEGREENEVRLWVKESGCSGYMYEIDFVDQPEEGDKTFHFGSIVMHVANKALVLLHGTEIDLVTEGVNKTIQFINPNAKAMCGCGESFTI